MVKPIEIATGVALFGGIALLAVRNWPAEQVPVAPAASDAGTDGVAVADAPPKPSPPPSPSPTIGERPEASAEEKPADAGEMDLAIALPVPAKPHREGKPDLTRTGPGAPVTFTYDRHRVSIVGRPTSVVERTASGRHDLLLWRTPWGEVQIGLATGAPAASFADGWPALPPRMTSLDGGAAGWTGNQSSGTHTIRWHRGTRDGSREAARQTSRSTAATAASSPAPSLETAHGTMRRRDVAARAGFGPRLCTQIVLPQGAASPENALHATFCRPGGHPFPDDWMTCVMNGIGSDAAELSATDDPACRRRSIARPGR